MEVRLRTVLETLKNEQCAHMKLAAELESLRSNALGKSFEKPPTFEKSIGSGRYVDNVLEDEKVHSSYECPPSYEDFIAPSS